MGKRKRPGSNGNGNQNVGRLGITRPEPVTEEQRQRQRQWRIDELRRADPDYCPEPPVISYRDYPKTYMMGAPGLGKRA